MKHSPRYEPLSDDASKLLITLLINEQAGNEPKADAELPFLSAIVAKRISGMKLPITFSPIALLAVNAFVDRPGSAVVLLMDALTKFEGQTVTASSLCDLYPSGFYDEESLTTLIDDVVKPRKCKWAEIY